MPARYCIICLVLSSFSRLKNCITLEERLLSNSGPFVTKFRGTHLYKEWFLMPLGYRSNRAMVQYSAACGYLNGEQMTISREIESGWQCSPGALQRRVRD